MPENSNGTAVVSALAFLNERAPSSVRFSIHLGNLSMLFPTIDFAVFFLVVFTVSWILRPHKIAWRWFILAASFVFYGWWDWNYLLLLILSIGINWFFGLAVFRSLTQEGERTNLSRWIVRIAVIVISNMSTFFFRALPKRCGRSESQSTLRFSTLFCPSEFRSSHSKRSVM